MGDRGGFGTSEEDRVNCPFYFKIGACRNGDRCNRNHIRPERSSTLLLPHLYPNLAEAMSIANDEEWDDDMYSKAQDHVEYFYEDIFQELATYGEVEDLVVLDNVSDHMIGNVYCKYFKEEAAENAMKGLAHRFYGARLLQPEYTPVTDFREARCRAFHETRCARGGLCNFMHVKHIPRAVKRRLVREMYDAHPEYAPFRDRERSPRREKPEAGDEKPKRPSTPERKAMIAQWTKDLRIAQPIVPAMPAPAQLPALAPPGGPTPPPPPMSPPPFIAAQQPIGIVAAFTPRNTPP